ncbi:hypothetical protein LOTGIDRAFT_214106 [Lottia gigantea]|uniref:CWH43-like N-terminal domain-containing protein n=1 Tax=Lottia gigantea TaxID=225164 RepID=V4AU29_LOTGI|nr:hypothetical protein LOTGIDRAFT_214106 [Lottia gigantea]ESO97281.1 hypothetical protein LOTGIDRAFT_214106 [Lottia gigantea]
MSSLGYLPIVLVLLSFATFIVTYIVAVVRDDVSAAFPYISDTGAEIPESCIFGQFLNLAACLAFCTMYVRYKSIQAIAGNEDIWLGRMNKVSFILGIISAIGTSMVANFQGYTAHVISTAGEWITAATFLCFFFTYVREFFKFELNIAMRPLVRHLDEEPYYHDRETNDERTRLLG